MTGAWLETEEEVIESRALFRNHLGSPLEEGESPEERREDVLNALDADELSISDIRVPTKDIITLSTTAPSRGTLTAFGIPHIPDYRSLEQS